MEALAVNVTVLLLAVLAGLKAAVTPAGSPLAARVTVLLKPWLPSTVMVTVPAL